MLPRDALELDAQTPAADGNGGRECGFDAARVGERAEVDGRVELAIELPLAGSVKLAVERGKRARALLGGAVALPLTCGHWACVTASL